SRSSAEAAQAVLAAERSERARAEAESAAARRTMEDARRINRWLLGGMLAAAALLLAALLQVRRSRRTRLQPVSEGALDLLPATPSGEEGWRERALAAEATAEKATALLQAKLLPHFARW